MKSLLVSALMLLSVPAFSSSFDCHFIVGGDVASSESFVFDGRNALTTTIDELSATIKIINVGTEDVHDLRLLMQINNVQNYATSLFNTAEDHPFMSGKLDGVHYQIQCWNNG